MNSEIRKDDDVNGPILVVDDDPDIHEILGMIAKGSGLHFVFALDGNTALEQYKSNQFDVVILDLTMAPMNGVVLTRKLLEINPATTIVTMTGSVDDEFLAEAREAGVWEVLKKPFHPEDLHRVVEAARTRKS